jgi:hypothetical protein
VRSGSSHHTELCTIFCLKATEPGLLIRHRFSSPCGSRMTRQLRWHMSPNRTVTRSLTSITRSVTYVSRSDRAPPYVNFDVIKH